MGDKDKPSDEDFDRVIAQLAKTIDAWTASVDAYRTGVMTGESPEELIRTLETNSPGLWMILGPAFTGLWTS